jgi:hypothetical protein
MMPKSTFWKRDLCVYVRELVKSGISVRRLNHLNIMQYSIDIYKMIKKTENMRRPHSRREKIRNINKYISKTYEI